MFHRGTYVWGGILILVGILLFLSNLGILVIDVWKVIVPSIVILIGILTIWGTTRPTRELEARSVQLPLEGAARAPLRLRFWAGGFALHGGGGGAALLAGAFRGGGGGASCARGPALARSSMGLSAAALGLSFAEAARRLRSICACRPTSS